MKALGLVLLECMTLKRIDEILMAVQKEGVERVLREFKSIDRFSKGMIYAVIALVEMMSRYLPRIGSLIDNSFKEE